MTRNGVYSSSALIIIHFLCYICFIFIYIFYISLLYLFILFQHRIYTSGFELKYDKCFNFIFTLLFKFRKRNSDSDKNKNNMTDFNYLQVIKQVGHYAWCYSGHYSLNNDLFYFFLFKYM